MYGKSPERRRRQKVSRAPTFRVENEQNPEEIPQYFQISVNVMEARKLTWSNPHSSSSYIVVVLGKKKFRSNIKRNMKDPLYNECYVYEMCASIQHLQQSSIWLAIMETRCCAPSRLLGETTIDLASIWAQPHHQVFHKWAQLIQPRDSSSGPVGFVRVDISIIFRGEMQEPLDNNLLLPTGSEQQRGNYLITVYGAYGLPSGVQSHGDKRYGKLPSTFVRVTFSGLVAKTAVQHRSNQPMYCEQISIVEMFPNICQTIRFEVCSADGYFNRVLSSTNLKLSLVSHDGENGFLPTFGPSMLHMYGTTCAGILGAASEDGPYHRGALLVSLKTVVPYYQQNVRTTCVEPVTPIKPESLWAMEDFWIYCPVLEVSMLNRRVTGKINGVALTSGEIYTQNVKDEEFSAIISEMRSRKLHYTGSMDVTQCVPDYGYLDFQNSHPILQLSIRLPDFRFRMFRNNMIQRIVMDLDYSICDIERRLQIAQYANANDLIDELNKAIDDAAASILRFLDITQYSSVNVRADDILLRHKNTELDQKQVALQREEMEKNYHQLTKYQKPGSYINVICTVNKQGEITHDSKKGVKLLIAEMKAVTHNLRNLIFKTLEGWPDLVIWLLNSGSRIAYARILMSDIIHSLIPEQSGKNCGKIQTIYLKPIKCPKHTETLATSCYCILGKLEVILWMGLYREIQCFESYLPDGMTLRVKGPVMTLKANLLMLECRIYIHRAKLSDVIDSTSYVYLRANILNSLQDTKAMPKTPNPTWNQILKIQITVFSSQQRISSSPPCVFIELYEKDLMENKLVLGSFQMQPVVDDRPEYQNAPKLQWHEIYRGMEKIGQVLIAAQLLQIPEKIIKTTMYSPLEESFYSTNVKEFDSLQEEIETLPLTLIPQLSTYKVDVYWWGLRDVSITRKPCVVLEMEELIIKSDIISDKKDSCNFRNGRSSNIFDGQLEGGYNSPLTIKLYDSGTFGRTLFLGTNVVKNPNKYIVNWIAQNEREASLKSASITSSDFSRVNQMTFVKKSSQLVKDCNFVNNTSVRSDKIKVEAKISAWKKLFSRTEPTEEEYVLLPFFAKEKEKNKVMKKSINQVDQNEQDWWLKYFHSLKDHNDEDETLTANKIKIYDSELESQPEFSKFKDWCSTLKFYNAKKTGIPEKDEQLFCGILKVGIAIYRWPPPSDTIAVSPSGVDLNNGYFYDLPNNETMEYLVRVYLVKGMELKKKGFTGKMDPYILLNCGKKVLGDRNTFIKNNANPIFGRMYEYRGTLPEDYSLTISLYDYDATQPDELIGSTVIDLEDRIYTKHRARTGLATQYTVTGPYKWHDCVKPSEILEDICVRNHLPHPLYPDFGTVIVNGVEYKDLEKDKINMAISQRKENICLTLLHQWHTLPICGYHLVPEHVETRRLYNPDKPGFEQGKIQMWVDLFPLDTETYIPPPVNITPQIAENYELRLIIWNVQQLKLKKNCANNKCPDIFVRTWIGTISQAQETDVHYHCTNGEVNFNWRMVFDLQYQFVEKKIVVNEKGPFTEYDERVLPILVVQVMDADSAIVDDALGILTLNLNSLPKGEKLAQQCSLEAMELAMRVNLFTVRCMRGWWPLCTVDSNSDKKIMAGVIDIELMLLPKRKALLMPVGLGRSSPDSLPQPQRSNMLSLFDSEEMSRQRLFKLVVMVLAIIFLGVFAIFYMDVFSSLESTEWISDNSDEKIRVVRNLYPVE